MRSFLSWLVTCGMRQALTILFVVACVVLGPAAIANTVQFSHLPAVAEASSITITIATEVAQPADQAKASEPILLAAADQTEHEVKMGSDNGLLAFVPKSVTISPGDTIDWVINKAPPHNVVFDTASMDAAQKGVVTDFPKPKLMIAAGDTYSVTFPEDTPPGRYPYYCTPHRGAGMVGEIVVQ